MPTPIIDLQRRLAIVGAVRAGGEKPQRGVGAKLEAWRVTSPRRELVEQAAKLYGGEVAPWQSPVGPEWQCYTQAEELPVLVMPGYSLQQTYELWEGTTKRQRVCDGVEESISGGGCICNAEGVDRCDIYSRLVVALPELDTALGWKLITKGANAAHELPTMLALIDARSNGAAFVPARIRIDQRRGVKDGQVVRYVVPVLDLGLSYLDMAGQSAARPALPPAGVSEYETTTRERLSAGEAVGALSSPRSGLGPRTPAMPDPDPNDFSATGAPPVDVQESPLAPSETIPVDTEHVVLDANQRMEQAAQQPMSDDDIPFGNEPTAQTTKRTPAQAKKLNVLVGKLRTPGHITTDGLYQAIASLRDMGGMELALELSAYDAEHELHWSPLRDSLTRVEANQLIDWLTIKEQRVEAGQT